MPNNLLFTLSHEGLIPPHPLGLALSCGRGHLVNWFWGETGIYRDAEWSIILYRRRLPLVPPKMLACIGFDVTRDRGGGESLTVIQIQGVKGRQPELARLRWDKMFLAMVVALGREYGYKKIKVLRSEHNQWRRMGCDPDVEDERRRAFHVRYDVLPRRMGFRSGDAHEERYHVLALP